jgi:hypothetical protein
MLVVEDRGHATYEVHKDRGCCEITVCEDHHIVYVLKLLLHSTSNEMLTVVGGSCVDRDRVVGHCSLYILSS